MSKELLKRVRDTLQELEETHYDLYWDIQAELDKPEQEPVAWMYEFTGDLDVRLERTGRVILLLEKQDWVESHTTGSYVESPLYTSPPKREPPITSREMYQRGYAAAERDLNREPLSNEAICEVLLKKEWLGFVELVRIIEKMHVIGIVE